MADVEKPIEIRFDTGEEITVTRQSMALYTFWGDLAMYDHVYMTKDGTDAESVTTEPSGCTHVYVFRGDEKYEALVDIIRDRGFRQYLNLLEVQDDDRRIFEEFRFADIESGFGASSTD